MLCNGSGHFNWSSSEEQKGGFSVFALVQGQLATDVDRDLDIDMDMDIGIGLHGHRHRYHDGLGLGHRQILQMQTLA